MLITRNVFGLICETVIADSSSVLTDAVIKLTVICDQQRLESLSTNVEILDWKTSQLSRCMKQHMRSHKEGD